MKQCCYLVIGSTGFIGSRVVSALIKKSNDVYTVSQSEDLQSSASKHFALNLLKERSLERVITHLREKFYEIKVFYLAGLTSVQGSINVDYSNVILTIKSYTELISCLKGTNSSIVFASSGAVYDASIDEYFDESSALRPISPYSVSKQCCESISIASNHLNNSNIKVARLFSVYGENMNRFFIYDLVKKLLSANKEVRMVGNGTQVRDYIHVDEASRGLIYIMDNGHSGETYNLCSGVPINLKLLSEMVRDILDKNSVNISWDNQKSIGSYDKWYGNPSKLYNLGFAPTIDFERQLKKTVLTIKNRILQDSQEL